MHLHPCRPRRALYLLLLLLHETRRTLIAASPSVAKAPKTRMEIREQDFSFNDGDRERPVIQVVTKDVRTSDIFSIMEAIGGEEEVVGATSWWKDAVTDEFSRQDVVVLALIALCVLRLVVFVIQMTWKLARLPMQWYDALKMEEDEGMEVESTDRGSEASSVRRKQRAIIRFCHLQYLLVVEKLKREMREDTSEDTQRMVASLTVSSHEDEKVTLSEILATLQKIQAKDSSVKENEVEEHLADIKQDVEDEEDIESGLPEAWERLQEIYASFLRIQATIIRRQKRKTWQWQMQHEHESEAPRKRQRRLPSEDATVEVLHELQELTKELPQGFTADMFTSLGNAMHEKMAADKPEIPPQLETKHSSNLSHTFLTCA